MAVTELSNSAMDGPVPRFWRRIWDCLDQVYMAAGYFAAFCMVMIFAVTMFQIVARYVGYNPVGLPNYVGYLTGAATFMAMAHTLNKGAHVRVSLFMSMMGKARPYAEALGLLFSAAMGSWFAFYCWRTVSDSYQFGDLSDGLDATPLWVPQLSMAVGATLLAIAVTDHFIRMMVTGDHGIQAADEVL